MTDEELVAHFVRNRQAVADWIVNASTVPSAVLADDSTVVEAALLLDRNLLRNDPEYMGRISEWLNRAALEAMQLADRYTQGDHNE